MLEKYYWRLMDSVRRWISRNPFDPSIQANLDRVAARRRRRNLAAGYRALKRVRRKYPNLGVSSCG